MKANRPSVGIDVSKWALDVSAYPDGNTWRVEHIPEGTAALAGKLADLDAVVVVEATGGLEVSLVAALGLAGCR